MKNDSIQIRVKRFQTYDFNDTIDYDNNIDIKHMDINNINFYKDDCQYDDIIDIETENNLDSKVISYTSLNNIKNNKTNINKGKIIKINKNDKYNNNSKSNNNKFKK